MSQLAITNVVNISVAQPPAGLADYKINNLLYMTKEVPVNSQPLGYGVYLDPQSVGVDWGTSSEAYNAAVAIFSQTPNILNGDGQLIIAPMQSADTITTMLQSIGTKIYFGAALYGGYAPNDAEILAGANAFQAAQKMLFISQSQVNVLNAGGIFFVIQSATLKYARMLLYTPGDSQARLMAAAYAGRAMSTDFAGSQTTITMHLKELIGVTPDPGISQTTLNLADTIGADLYILLGPLPKVWSSGGNTYFDQIYGTLWLIFALQVAVFNSLATSPTKVPQTEPGMQLLVNAATGVCQQAVTNGFSAPGSWNSPQLFGNPADLIRAVLQRGFYVYHQPVNQQSQTQRAARVAPLMQIALKLAGAIQKANVIVYLNP